MYFFPFPWRHFLYVISENAMFSPCSQYITIYKISSCSISTRRIVTRVSIQKSPRGTSEVRKFSSGCPRFTGLDPGCGLIHRLSSHAVAGIPHIKQKKMGTDISSGPVFLSKKRQWMLAQGWSSSKKGSLLAKGHWARCWGPAPSQLPCVTCQTTGRGPRGCSASMAGPRERSQGHNNRWHW